MIHFDLSSNNFGYPDACEISTALEENHTIYGFHFAGNSGYVDTRGFLVPEKVSKDASSLVKKKRIKGLKVVENQMDREEREECMRDTCWIC